MTRAMVRHGDLSDKPSSKEHGPRGKECLEEVPCNPQPVPSTSQLPSTLGDGAQTTNDELDRLTTLLSGFIEKCSAEKEVSSPEPRGFHDISTSESDDPLDGLDGLTVLLSSLPAPALISGRTFSKLILEDLAGSFLREEDKGDPLSSKLADI